MAVRKIEHVGIMVKDLHASIAFYKEFVGLELLGTLVHNNGTITLAFLSFPEAMETQVELIAGYPNELASEGIVHHVAFTVDDIEFEVTRLQGLNARFVDQDITTLSNGARYIFFYGPDGERIEFFQPAH